MAATPKENQHIHRMLFEYLRNEGFANTQTAFEDELAERGQDESVRRVAAKPVDVAEVMEAFELGERQAFFALWDRALGEELRHGNRECQCMEFRASLHFAVYGYHSADQAKVEAEKKAFKEYLETRGAGVAQQEEFVAFYALPYIPDPRTHPSFKALFTEGWTESLAEAIRSFLAMHLTSDDLPPSLVAMVKEHSLGGAGGRKGIHGDQASMVAKYNKVTKQLKEITHSYHTLVGVSTEMVSALEIAVKEKMIKPEFLTRVCSKLFQSSSAQAMDLTRPGTATSILRASIAASMTTPRTLQGEAPYLTSINFPKIKQDLRTLPNREKSAIVQALRWRLTRSSPAQRDQTLGSYVSHDLLGLAGRDKESPMTLDPWLAQEDPQLQEQLARMINTLASLQKGRAYLTRGRGLVSSMVTALRRAGFEDTAFQKNVVGCLQKLSLRRQSQSEMIAEGLILWTVQLLSGHAPSLSEYTFHYSLALLMNLSLRTKGRQSCVPVGKSLLRLLSDLLEHDSPEVSSYVNGILYSVLSQPDIRQEARLMGMEAMLLSAINSSPPDMKGQLEYIMQQLLSNSIPNESGGDSDGEEEEEEEEDPDIIDGDDGECPNGLGGVVGEDLLRSRYLSVVASVSAPTLPSVKKLKTSVAQDVPLSRPVTPLTYSVRSSSGAPPPHSSTTALHPSDPAVVAPVVSMPVAGKPEEAFFSRPKIPRTPEGPPAPPTPSQSPPPAHLRPRPPTRSGQTISVKK